MEFSMEFQEAKCNPALHTADPGSETKILLFVDSSSLKMSQPMSHQFEVPY